MDRQTSYWEALTELARNHGDVVTAALHMPSGCLSSSELAIVINHAMGADLRRTFDVQGQLALRDLGKAMKSHPRPCPSLAVKALAWHDRACMKANGLLPSARAGEHLQPAVEHAFNKHRRIYAAQSLGQIIHNQRQLTDALTQVVSDLEQMDCPETQPATLRAHFNTIRSLFRSSEWHARMAVLWAIRNGLLPERIKDSLIQVYIRPIIGIANKMQALEDRLGLHDYQRPSTTARRGAKRLELELLDVTRQVKNRSQRRAASPGSNAITV